MSLLAELVDRGHTGLSIGGEWRSASDGETIEVLDPATGEPLASVASGSEGDAIAAVDAAAAAGSEWSATAPADRSEILRRRQLSVDRFRQKGMAGNVIRRQGLFQPTHTVIGQSAAERCGRGEVPGAVGVDH